MDNICRILQEEFSLEAYQVENTVAMIDEGNTIPFIARYRKEKTGSLSDDILRDLYTRLNALRALEEKRSDILRLIDEQGKLTDKASIICQMCIFKLIRINQNANKNSKVKGRALFTHIGRSKIYNNFLVGKGQT